MRVFFRVDSSNEIGSGHLIRSLFLAKSLKEKGLDCTFISRDLNGNFNNLISDMGFKLIPLKKPKIIENINPVKSKSNYESWLKISFSEDAKEVINILQKKEIDLLIVDHYALDIKWEKILKKYVKKILVIDDLVNRNHFCDILIDPTYDRKPIDYQSLTNKNCIVFSGSDYAIINSKFSDQREKSIKRLFNKNKIKILVSLGGIDKYELSHKIIKILSKENFFLITVLINPISKNYIYVKELCAKYDHINQIDFSYDMPNILLNHDIIIGCPGTSTWERACMGIPSVVIPVAENQIEISEILQQKVASIILDRLELSDSLLPSIYNIVNNWKKMHKNNLKLCDGLGVNRISYLIKNIININSKTLTLIKATNDDVKLVYKWQKEPITRRFSFNSNVPDWDKHRKWMKSKLKKFKDFFYLIFDYEKNLKIGVVRLDSIEDSNYLISIYVDPDFHNIGIGSYALKIIDYFHPNINIIAEVKSENKSSVSLFLKAGYRKIKTGKFVRTKINQSG